MSKSQRSCDRDGARRRSSRSSPTSKNSTGIVASARSRGVEPRHSLRPDAHVHCFGSLPTHRNTAAAAAVWLRGGGTAVWLPLIWPRLCTRGRGIQRKLVVVLCRHGYCCCCPAADLSVVLPLPRIVFWWCVWCVHVRALGAGLSFWSLVAKFRPKSPGDCRLGLGFRVFWERC